MNTSERNTESVTEDLNISRRNISDTSGLSAHPGAGREHHQVPAFKNFSGRDIFGLSQVEVVRETVQKTRAHFAGPLPAYQLFYDRIHLCTQLEMAISSFNGYSRSHLFLNAEMAIQALIETCNRSDLRTSSGEKINRTLILADRKNYPQLVTAAGRIKARLYDRYSLSGNAELKIKPFKHADPADLAEQLKTTARTGDRIVVFSDAVFSKERTTVPLLGLISVLSDFPGSILILDETDSTGILGPHGTGIYEYFDIERSIVSELGIEPIALNSLAHFGASSCAAVSSNHEQFIELLDGATTSSNTSAYSPPEMAMVLKCIDYLKKHPELRVELGQG